MLTDNYKLIKRPSWYTCGRNQNNADIFHGKYIIYLKIVYHWVPILYKF